LQTSGRQTNTKSLGGHKRRKYLQEMIAADQ
jgi:hypothetical protein